MPLFKANVCVRILSDRVCPMFTSLLLELAATRPVDVIGDHMHGWLLSDQVAPRDPELFDRLHAPVRGKPFTVWLGPRFALGPAGVSQEESESVHWLRVTSIDSRLSALLPEIASSAEVEVVTLGTTQFRRLQVLENGQHPWTGTLDPKELWSRWMAGPPPCGRVRLRFLSPTTFAKGRGSTTLFPVASLVFRSLLKTWNENVTPVIGVQAVAELLQAVQEESHDLHTVPPLRFQSHQLKGFVGVCEYSCGAKSSEESRRLLHLLADFAFFAGVGLKRTMGMGQVIGESV